MTTTTTKTQLPDLTHREKLAYADLLTTGRTVEEVARAFGVSKWAIYKRARRAAGKLAAAGISPAGSRPVEPRRRRTRPMSQYDAGLSGNDLAEALFS